VIRVVLLEDFEDEFCEDGTVRQVREAVSETAGGVTARHQLQRDHVDVTGTEGDVVDTIHEVGRDAVAFKELKDVAGRPRGCGSLSVEHIVLGSVTGGDDVLAADEHFTMTRILDDLGLAFCHYSRQACPRGLLGDAEGPTDLCP